MAASYGVFVESSRIVLRKIVGDSRPAQRAVGLSHRAQVTDIHISRFQTQLHHLERGGASGLRKPRPFCPTGDLCDEPRLHLDTLRIIRQVPARLGHIACAGNHELYLADPLTISRAYEKRRFSCWKKSRCWLGLRIAGLRTPVGCRGWIGGLCRRSLKPR